MTSGTIFLIFFVSGGEGAGGGRHSKAIRRTTGYEDKRVIYIGQRPPVGFPYSV